MMRFGFLSLVLAFSVQVRAFPEMIRHGYVNCTVCHTSLVGGNLLTPYGRSLSKELLSQTDFFGLVAPEGSEGFLGGAVETPEWLLAGGDIRLLQTFIESSQASRGRFLIMQVDFDLSAQVKDWLRIFFSVGRTEPRVDGAVAKDYVTSPRHGVEFIFNPQSEDDRVTLRLGRFMPAYGILFPEHTFATRTYLDFGPGQERGAAELAWTHEMTSVILTGIFNQAAANRLVRETGGILQVNTAIGESVKLGANYYQTTRDDGSGSYQRRMYGAYALMGFTKEWYGLLDLNRVQRADGRWGLVETFKLGHELWQGFHLFGVHEFANLNTDQTDPKFEAYGLGTQWYPQAHWELYGIYRKERNSATLSDFQDVVWLIGHYYL